MVFSLKADGVISNLGWNDVVKLLLAASAVCVIFAGLSFVMAAKLYCKYRRLYFRVAGPLFKGFSFIFMALYLGYFYCRAMNYGSTFIVSFCCLAYLFFFMIFNGCYLNIEVTVHLADGRFVALVKAPPKKITFQKIEEENILYKLSENWVTLNE